MTGRRYAVTLLVCAAAGLTITAISWATDHEHSHVTGHVTAPTEGPAVAWMPPRAVP